MRLLTTEPPSTAGLLRLDNTADVRHIALDGVQCIELRFPKFTDGRAFTQAVLLRRQRGFTGTLRATGDVLIDQLLQMQRCGFDEALLRPDQDAAHGQRLLRHFSAFYQGDAQQARPRFARVR